MNFLTKKDIAKLLQYTLPYVRDVLIKTPGFPRPDLAPSRQSQRWKDTTIMGWIDAQREKIAR